MAGFFGTVKAINKCTDELIVVGKEYALKFKANKISAKDYESEMVGKIYELSNKYANGDEDLEKYLKQHFADPSVKFLKEGIQLYVESTQQSTEPQQNNNEFANENIPPDSTEQQVNTKLDKSLKDANSNQRVVTSNKKRKLRKY